MIKLSFILFISLLSSCSINQTRRPIKTSEVIINGGNYKDNSWDEKLIFNRTSWYEGINLVNEILLAEMGPKSKFALWMGADRLKLASCSRFKVVLLYSSTSTRQTNASLALQIQRNGVEIVDILDFTYQLQAHQNFYDWKLGHHRIKGLCIKDSAKTDIEIALPGFLSKIIKL